MPFKINCPQHGERVFPDDGLGIKMWKGGVERWSDEIAGLLGKKEYYTANCPECQSTFAAVKIEGPPAEKKA